MEINEENLHIDIYFPEHESSLIAIAKVEFTSFDFVFVVVKFYIWKSKKYNDRLGENINISPPTSEDYKSKHVWVYPKEAWLEIEKMIYRKYLKALSAKQKEESNKEERN